MPFTDNVMNGCVSLQDYPYEEKSIPKNDRKSLRDRRKRGYFGMEEEMGGSGY